MAKKTNKSFRRLNRWLDKHRQSRLSRLVRSPQFGLAFARLAFIVLLGTTIFWAWGSAHVQSGNADQLVNSYLFQNAPTFRNAELPNQHSFLVKWPVFYLIQFFGSTPSAFVVATVALSVLTVSVLAIMLYRLERRPLVIGSLWLALASVLLMVPAQPNPGVLLPVNMAMVATRNIEYLVLLTALYLVVCLRKRRRVGFWVGVGLLGLLIASDKLFLSLAVGGALVALVLYVMGKRWTMASLAARWLVAGLAAIAVSIGALLIVTGAHVTQITGQGTAPYNFVHSARELIQGVIYAIVGIFTNFGANPSTGTSVLKQMPADAVQHMLSVAALPLLVNALLAVSLILLMVRQALRSLFKYHREASETAASRYSLILIWMSVASVIIFVGTDHYYAGDARYLSLIVFAAFITAASTLRHHKLRAELVAAIGVLLFISAGFGVVASHSSVKAETAALSTVNQRNRLVADALRVHPVEVLAGDYWRVIPARLAAENHLNVMPLEACAQARGVLSSQAWQPNLAHHSFAYLLSFDQKISDFPSCSLSQIIEAYGRPNSSLLIAGTIDKPQELLLFYDQGARHSIPLTTTGANSTATVLPINLDDLPSTMCKGPTTLNVVAHQDDDLLFMNPDILHGLRDGHCIRTIYMTAGDAGAGAYFWLSRQQGSEAAYSQMLNSHEVWNERIVKLADHQFVTIANPRGNSNVSLIFMHLPDGNLGGQGFAASHGESLSRLHAREVDRVHSVDGQSSYTSDQLKSALVSLMQTYLPTEIHTQADYANRVFPDHSDHRTVGIYTREAYEAFETAQFQDILSVPLHFYIGYPIRALPENVSGDELAAKEAAFFAYSKFDNGVCHSAEDCLHYDTYNSYLHRQYRDPAEAR